MRRSAVLQQWTCHTGNTDQQGQFQPTARGNHKVVSRNSGTSPGPSTAATADGAKVSPWTYGNGHRCRRTGGAVEDVTGRHGPFLSGPQLAPTAQQPLRAQSPQLPGLRRLAALCCHNRFVRLTT